MNKENMKLNQLTIKEASQGLHARKFSARELAQACLDQIAATDKKIKAFITVTADLALKQASEIDAKIKSGEKLGVLAGIPGAIKDIIATEGIKTTASSNILKDYVPPYDAACITTLKKEGLVHLGKTNLDAFAHGSSTENSDFFTTRNPWDLDRVPGGSSGGAAASVAANQTLYSLGTDTGGSIRQPAGFCNIVGFKPTYGRVSRYGLLAMTSSTDCLSLMTKTVEDSAILLNALAGQDKHDGTTVPVKVPDYTATLNKGVKKLKVGVPKEYFIKGMNPGVEKTVREAIKKFQELGAEIHEVSLPHTKYAVAVYYIVTPSEVSTNLSRYDGVRYGYSIVNDKTTDTAKNLIEVYTKSRRHGFGSEAKRRIMMGTYALSSGYYDAYYLQASKVRTLIRQDFSEAFKKVDLLLTPTSPDVAFKVGAKGSDPLQMYLEDIFLTAVSLAGVPAITIPCGFTTSSDGAPTKLPVGLQIVGNYFDEALIFQAANAYEQATEWHKMKPSIS